MFGKMHPLDAYTRLYGYWSDEIGKPQGVCTNYARNYEDWRKQDIYSSRRKILRSVRYHLKRARHLLRPFRALVNSFDIEWNFRVHTSYRHRAIARLKTMHEPLDDLCYALEQLLTAAKQRHELNLAPEYNQVRKVVKEMAHLSDPLFQETIVPLFNLLYKNTFLLAIEQHIKDDEDYETLKREFYALSQGKKGLTIKH